MAPRARTAVRGKFLFAGPRKLYVRGVTYGTFRPSARGDEFPTPDRVEQDFAAMAARGFNAVRTYTVPPRWLLDAAWRHGLFAMVGLPWEQHVTFLDERERARSIEQRLRAGVRQCAGHPAVLAYAVGNEIPPAIVRWHGPRRVEHFVERLCEAAREEDPAGLVTYVSFPSTEYLELPFLDFLCFNVYLEAQPSLESYLARLQNIAGDRPLVVAEIGLDSRRHGEEAQARSLAWQVRTAFESGCAGAFVFAWTDEWHRGGHDIGDWDFGLTDRGRRPKPALSAVEAAFAEAPFGLPSALPRISVLVCTHNGAPILPDCLQGLTQLDYPDYEVIVVNDGSSDGSSRVARQYDCRLIETPPRGLSSARNTGLAAATGSIVAYIDDDARPDPDWLRYLAAAFTSSDHAGIGGPNLAPAGDGHVAECVANAPGGPVQVLVSDREAEHIPGCNMAFRKEALTAVGGFDPRFRTAGDDVDLCWRLRERGLTLGFSPAAVVWHHRRNSLAAYWRQQKGYGRAEALLEKKWPEKYNSLGHLHWAGRMYGNGLAHALRARRARIVYGTWGSGLFQSVYRPADGLLGSLPLMPEWYLLIGVLAVLSALGALWPPLLLTQPLLAAAIAAQLATAVLSAARASFPSRPRTRWRRLRLRALTALLYLIQPLARLSGRVSSGLTPWRVHAGSGWVPPQTRLLTTWSETWAAPETRLAAIEESVAAGGTVVVRGGECDRWDLELRPGALGHARVLAVTEEHGAGRQLTRFRVAPRYPAQTPWSIALAGALAIAAAATGSPIVALAFASATLVLTLRAAYEAGAACAAALRAVGDRLPDPELAPALDRLRVEPSSEGRP